MTIDKAKKLSLVGVLSIFITLSLWGIITSEVTQQSMLSEMGKQKLINDLVQYKWVDVERICLEWKKRFPKNPVATWLLRWAYLGQNKMRDASILHGEFMLFDKKSWDNVVSFTQEIVNVNRESSTAWSLLSDAQRYAGNIDKALRCSERALSIDKRAAHAWTVKSLALAEMDRLEEAVKCFDRAIGIDPNYTRALNNKGVVLADMNRYNEAISCYDKSIRINPKDGVAWLNKGVALFKMNRYNEAVKCFDKAIEINSNYAYAWYNKGGVLYVLKNYQEAKECLKRADKLGHPQAQKVCEILEREGH